MPAHCTTRQEQRTAQVHMPRLLPAPPATGSMTNRGIDRRKVELELGLHAVLFFFEIYIL